MKPTPPPNRIIKEGEWQKEWGEQPLFERLTESRPVAVID